MQKFPLVQDFSINKTRADGSTFEVPVRVEGVLVRDIFMVDLGDGLLRDVHENYVTDVCAFYKASGEACLITRAQVETLEETLLKQAVVTT